MDALDWIMFERRNRGTGDHGAARERMQRYAEESQVDDQCLFAFRMGTDGTGTPWLGVECIELGDDEGEEEEEGGGAEDNAESMVVDQGGSGTTTNGGGGVGGGGSGDNGPGPAKKLRGLSGAALGASSS